MKNKILWIVCDKSLCVVMWLAEKLNRLVTRMLNFSRRILDYKETL